MRKKIKTKTKNLPVSPRLLLTGLSLLFFFNVIVNLSSLGPAGDARIFHVYWKEFIRTSFLAGRMPFWNPYIFCGEPFLAAVQRGVFNPFNILYLIMPVSVGVNIECIIHFFLAGWFMCLLVRDLKLSRSAAVMGGIIWAFNGVAFGNFAAGYLNQLDAYIWLPVIFMLTRRLLNGGGLKNLIFLSLAFGAQFLTGYPQYWMYSGLIIGFYTLWWTVDLKRKNENPAKALKGAAWVSLGAALGIGIILIQLLPALELLRYASAAAPPPGPAYYFQGSFPIVNLPVMLTPSIYGNAQSGVYFGRGLFWDNCVFLGVWALILVVVGIVRGNRMTEGRFFPVLAAAGLVFAMGANTPVYPLLFRFFPIVRYLKQPSGALYVFMFAMSVMASFGFESILGGRRQKSREGRKKFLMIVVIIGIFLAIIGLAVFVFRGNIWAAFEDQFIKIVKASGQINPSATKADIVSKALMYIELNFWDLIRTATALSLGCYLIYGYEKRVYTRRTLSLAMPLVVFSEMFFFAQPFIRPRAFRGVDMGPLARTAIESIASRKENEPFRVFVLNPAFMRNEGMLVKLQNLDGNDTIVLNNFAGFVNDFYRKNGIDHQIYPAWGITLNTSIELAGLAARLNAKYAVTVSLVESNNAVWNQDYWKLEYSNGLAVYRNLLDSSYLRFLPPPGMPAGGLSYEIKEYTPNSITADVRVNAAGTVVFNEVFYPAWKAWVDGNPARVIQVDGLFRGVEVEPGAHHIVMRYASDSFRWGMMISIPVAAGLLMILLGIYFREWKSRIVIINRDDDDDY